MRNIEPKVDEMMESSLSVPKKSEPTKTYPHLRLDHQFFPESKKWEVGKEYEVTLKLKMTGLSIARWQNDSEFDIVGFECEGMKEDKDKKEDTK